MLIGELANRAGVSRRAIRLYETLGILPASTRTPARYRQYDERALAVLTFVAGARRLGGCAA